MSKPRSIPGLQSAPPIGVKTMNHAIVNRTVTTQQRIKVSVSDDKARLYIHTRKSENTLLIGDMGIEITSGEFLNLVCPILDDLGYYSAPIKGVY